MPRIFLRDCNPGEMVEDVFVFSGKQLSTGSNGKMFIKAFVGDKSMSVPARIWSATREMFNSLPDGGFIRLRGRVENYQGNLQIVVDQTWPARDGMFDLADLLPHTKKPIGAMCEKLSEILGSLQNRHLSALVHAYLDDETLMKDFCRAPAAMSFHHAFLGGLLEHTLNALEVGDAIVKFYPGLSRDLVLAGIFLHDIAKTWELTYENSFGYSDGGQLVGHIVKSAIWVEHKAKQAEAVLGEPIPQRLIDVIQHIIISHHGTPEFGAVKVPGTPEAIAVHMIENMDAKLTMSLGATRGDSAGESNWTEYMKAMGGRMYRPDVTLTDSESTEPSDSPPSAAASTPASAPLVVNSPPLKDAHPGLRITNPLFESAGKRP